MPSRLRIRMCVVLKIMSNKNVVSQIAQRFHFVLRKRISNEADHLFAVPAVPVLHNAGYFACLACEGQVSEFSLFGAADAGAVTNHILLKVWVEYALKSTLCTRGLKIRPNSKKL